MYRRILVGYDGSAAGRKAFEMALALAAQHGAELHVISVARPSEIGDDVETEAVIEHSRAYHRRLLAELKASAATKQVKRTTKWQWGIPPSSSSITPTAPARISS